MDADYWEGFLKCATEMGSGTVTHIPSFIKTGPGIQKLERGWEET
jgi:hypothetical protein